MGGVSFDLALSLRQLQQQGWSVDAALDLLRGYLMESRAEPKCGRSRS